jgi:hypothetical protein
LFNKTGYGLFPNRFARFFGRKQAYVEAKVGKIGGSFWGVAKTTALKSASLCLF